jgi:hypothetical protein
LASLTIESLNTLASTLSNAQALSAVIACIYKGLDNIGESGDRPEKRQSSPSIMPKNKRNDASIPLSGFEPFREVEIKESIPCKNQTEATSD